MQLGISSDLFRVCWLGQDWFSHATKIGMTFDGAVHRSFTYSIRIQMFNILPTARNKNPFASFGEGKKRRGHVLCCIDNPLARPLAHVTSLLTWFLLGWFLLFWFPLLLIVHTHFFQQGPRRVKNQAINCDLLFIRIIILALALVAKLLAGILWR